MGSLLGLTQLNARIRWRTLEMVLFNPKVDIGVHNDENLAYIS